MEEKTPVNAAGQKMKGGKCDADERLCAVWIQSERLFAAPEQQPDGEETQRREKHCDEGIFV